MTTRWKEKRAESSGKSENMASKREAAKAKAKAKAKKKPKRVASFLFNA